MSWSRIRGIVRQDIYMTYKEITLAVDLFFFSTINVVLFGLIAKHFAGSNPESSRFVLSGMLLWEVIRLCQYTVTVTSLWNVWSHNLSNMFIAPISLLEFVSGNILSAVVKSMVTFLPLALATILIFDFNIFSVGAGPFALAFVALCLFACALGMLLLGLIFRYGTRVQALAWSAVYLFQPLIGIYFPLDVLPRVFQLIAYAIPATHTFIGIRNALTGEGPVYGPLLLSTVMGLVAITMGYWAFSMLHKRSMVVGQFARNES